MNGRSVMIAVHGTFHTMYRKVVKRQYVNGKLSKYHHHEAVGMEERRTHHIFIESGGKWKAPCGAKTKRIVGVATSFEDKITRFKTSPWTCRKCRRWLEKNEASLRMAEAVS